MVLKDLHFCFIVTGLMFSIFCFSDVKRLLFCLRLTDSRRLPGPGGCAAQSPPGKQGPRLHRVLVVASRADPRVPQDLLPVVQLDFVPASAPTTALELKQEPCGQQSPRGPGETVPLQGHDNCCSPVSVAFLSIQDSCPDSFL